MVVYGTALMPREFNFVTGFDLFLFISHAEQILQLPFGCFGIGRGSGCRTWLHAEQAFEFGFAGAGFTPLLGRCWLRTGLQITTEIGALLVFDFLRNWLAAHFTDGFVVESADPAHVQIGLAGFTF